MPVPFHVTLLRFGQILQRANTSGPVVVILQSEDFDKLLTYMQEQPGAINQPTNVEADSFTYQELEVRRA